MVQILSDYSRYFIQMESIQNKQQIDLHLCIIQNYKFEFNPNESTRSYEQFSQHNISNISTRLIIIDIM